MATMTGFVEKHRVRMTAELVDSNPHMNGMPAGSTHWRCTLRRGNRRMTVYFSQGPAICREPEARDVLDCLASDASTYDNAGSFEEWAGEFGYDPDSRKAEKTYKAVESQAKKLRAFLPDDAYEALLYDTERL